MSTTPETKSALALALIAGALVGADTFPLPLDTHISGALLLSPGPPAMAPTHCPRCTAPMVRARDKRGGRYLHSECIPCWSGGVLRERGGRRRWRQIDYDSRDWRRLRRWRAVRGLVTA